MFEALLAAGADIDARDGDGRTPLYIGRALTRRKRESGRARDVCWLPGRTSTPGMTTMTGRPCITRPLGNENPAVLETLLAAGADLVERER